MSQCPLTEPQLCTLSLPHCSGFHWKKNQLDTSLWSPGRLFSHQMGTTRNQKQKILSHHCFHFHVLWEPEIQLSICLSLLQGSAGHPFFSTTSREAGNTLDFHTQVHFTATRYGTHQNYLLPWVKHVTKSYRWIVPLSDQKRALSWRHKFISFLLPFQG